MGEAAKMFLRNFYEERRVWRKPDILINPIGTLIIYQKKQWVCAPWIEGFMIEARKCFTYEPTVMLSLPVEKQNAGLWDLEIMRSGLSKYFGDHRYLWAGGPPPLSGVVAIRNIGYPPGVEPHIYIESIPDRILATHRHEDVTPPDEIIYWRPADSSIAGMNRYKVNWNDAEEEILDIAHVRFAGLPEDVIALLEA